MHLKVTIEIDGRQAGTVEGELSSQAEELEEQTQQYLQRAGRIVLETGLQGLETSCQKPTCCGAVRSRGYQPLTIKTMFGPVKLSRRRYRCRKCGEDFYPMDALWRCGSHRISRPLAKRVCQLATVEHFTRLPELLAAQHGVHLEHEAILELVHDIGGVAEAQRRLSAELVIRRDPRSGQQIVPEVQAQRVWVSCDGIMYCTNRSEPDPSQPGTERLIWQQMKVGCVAWQDLEGDWHKQLVWGRESPEEFGAALFQLACRLGYLQARDKLFAADGGEWCWKIRNRYFYDAHGILDWYHASEHIWETARQVGTVALSSQAWGDAALAELRAKGGAGLATWLEGQIVSRRGKARAALEKLRKYVQERRSEMNYSEYRSQGWPIGTGRMESSCKQLVALRLKGPGMHWTESGALAVTALRAIELNGKWNEFWHSLVLVV